LYQLDDFAAHEINGRDQHGHRIGMPAPCSSRLRSAR
jgi:hypothetical protein